MSLDPSTFVWMIINFILLMVLLNKFLFKPMLEFMQKRQEKIAAGIRAGEEAEQLLADKKAELAEKMVQAKNEAADQINAASRELSNKKAQLEAENSAYTHDCMTEIARSLFDEEERLAAVAEEHMPEYISIIQNKLMSSDSARTIMVSDKDARNEVLSILSQKGELV